MSVNRKPAARPKEIFLSHATGDRRFADRLAGVMRKQGIPVWYSRTHLRGAQQWQDEIGQALERCDWFLIILSPNSVKSMWVKRELAYALNEQRYQNRIVPVLFRPCDHKKFSWTLASFQMVNFTGSFAKSLPGLLKIWRPRHKP